MSDVDHSICGSCGEAVTGEVVPVGDETWHQRCAMRHVIESMAAQLVPAPRRDPLLDAHEVADQLGGGFSADSVMRRKDQIGYVRLRREGVAEARCPVRFRQEDVDRYIDENFEQRSDEDPAPRRRVAKPLTSLQQRYPHLRSPSQR